MARFRDGFLLALLGSLAGPPALAGLYSPLERLPVPIDGTGRAEELSFGSRYDGAFPQLFSVVLNQLDANPARAVNPDRQRAMDWIAERRPKAAELPPDELAGLGAALARVGKTDDALNLLGPRVRDRVPDFRILANLAHVHAAVGNWDDAFRLHRDAFELADYPTELPGAMPAQRAWLEKLERTHYRRWLQLHRDRAAAKADPADSDVFPLFPARFVNDAGVYEAGKLADAERAKLPADAIPVVQQLLLWAPWDTDLYWLLAELYAADGRFREAEVIFNQCAEARLFSNRQTFMAHRAAVREAVSKLPPEAAEDVPLIAPDPQPPADFLPSRGTLIAGAAAFALLAFGLFALQVRAVMRKRKTARG